jgi:putative nucleotidyltransferase with HDIG domain
MKIISILKKLNKETPAEVYYAGKYVRDLVRRKKSNRIEIVVRHLQLREVSKYLRRYRKDLKIKRMNSCIILSTNNIDILIRNPRKGNRYSPYYSLREDAKEKIFTVNAMYLPITSKDTKDLVDIYNGRGSIRSRKIKVIGKSTAVVKRNPSIMMKAISLSSRLNYKIESNLFYAIKSNHALLKNVSVNKTRSDFVKIVMSGKPSKYLRIMHDSGLMHAIMPELSICYGVTQNRKYHKYDTLTHCLLACDNIERNLILRLAALLHDIGKAQVREESVKNGRRKITFYNHEVASSKTARRILKRLKFDKETVLAVSDLIYNHMYNYEPDKWSDAAIRRFIAKLHITNKDINRIDRMPIFLLRKADRAANGLNLSEVSPRQIAFENRIKHVYNLSKVLHVKDLNIDGNMLMERFNLKQGPTIGHILNHLLSLVIEDQSLNESEALIEEASKYLSEALK